MEYIFIIITFIEYFVILKLMRDIENLESDQDSSSGIIHLEGMSSCATIGQTLKYRGRKYVCAESKAGDCVGCDFAGKQACDLTPCTRRGRGDHKNVIFKLKK